MRRVFIRRGTVEILILLRHGGYMRFGEIVDQVPNIAQQVIGSRLAELREIGMVRREVEEGPPLATRYSLTELGAELTKAAEILETVSSSDQLPAIVA